MDVQSALGALQPARVEDLVAVTQVRPAEAGVEAVDLAFEPVRVEVAEGEHPAERTGVPAGRADGHEPAAYRGQPGLVANGEAQVVEAAPAEHRRAGSRRGVVGGLEHVQHHLAREHDRLTVVPGPRAEDQHRVEAEGVFVEGAVAVEVGCHDRDVVDAAGASDSHTLRAFTAMERCPPGQRSTVHVSAAAGSGR